MYRSRKSFEEKATEYERLKAIGHQIVDQMTRVELQRFCRRKRILERQPQMMARSSN
jgi:hypothetical protein